jgi:hypothetical protein
VRSVIEEVILPAWQTTNYALHHDVIVFLSFLGGNGNGEIPFLSCYHHLFINVDALLFSYRPP